VFPEITELLELPFFSADKSNMYVRKLTVRTEISQIISKAKGTLYPETPSEVKGASYLLYFFSVFARFSKGLTWPVIFYISILFDVLAIEHIF